MASVSVVICCADSGDTLGAACASAAFADELIVVDSGSTDATAEIAKAHADRYVVEPWRGYTGQKKFGAGLATHEWVLVLDGDEEVSAGLAEEIVGLSDEALAGKDVFEVRRRNWVMGRVVRAWWPDWQSRLIHRGRAVWSEQALHDARGSAAGASRVSRLAGHLEHKRVSAAGFGDYFGGARMDGRLMMVAREMRARGKRARWWDLVLRPRVAWVKSYVLKGGWRDGVFGLLIAQKAAVSTQLKYAALWAAEREEAEEHEGGPDA